MKKTFLYLIFFLALIERVWFDLGPNIELITLATILTTFYLNKKTAFILTFSIVVLSDLLIGNSNIFLFTWSGFILPIFLIAVISKLKQNKILLATIAGISSNLFFYIWTNFGVWALDSWGMYPKTALGLTMSFINGLPFLKYQLTSTLFFVPLGFLVYEVLFNKLLSKIYLLIRNGKLCLIYSYS